MITCGNKILFDKDIEEEDVEQQIIQVFFKKQMIYLSEHLENDPDVDIEKADEDQWKRSISKFMSSKFSPSFEDWKKNYGKAAVPCDTATANMFAFYIYKNRDQWIPLLFNSVVTTRKFLASYLRRESERAVIEFAADIRSDIYRFLNYYNNDQHDSYNAMLNNEFYKAIKTYNTFKDAVFDYLIEDSGDSNRLISIYKALLTNDRRYLTKSVFDQMIQFLTLSYPMRDEIVPCLVGPPGIGKTAAVREHAKRVGAKHVVTIIASQILPNEVSGITMPDAETKAMEIYDHYKLGHLEDGDIIFFDELLEADQCVLSACLTLIESRMLMSGKQLPSVQIVAATNPTIQPTSLRLNIRQRFIFKKFKLDKAGTGEYIKSITGMEIDRPTLDLLSDEGTEYNVLTPRSLTKLAKWVMATPEKDLNAVKELINETWDNQIGTRLVNCRPSSKKLNERKVKEKIQELAYAMEDDQEVLGDLDHFFDSSTFKEGGFEDIIQELSKLINWDYLAKQLDQIDLD